MRLKLNEKQVKMLNKIGFDFDVQKDLTDDEFFKIDDRVADYLMMYGFENQEEPNEIGLICESILDILSEY